jgi:hypothetical protein
MILLKRSEMMSFIRSLKADEAFNVLKDLLDDNPELTKKAYEIALKIAGDVDVDALINNEVMRVVNGDYS